MTWVVPLALGGVAILVMAVFTMLSSRKRHRAIVAPAPAAGPRILVHDINDDRCTGCDACVAVCPTNVLDLVANKSRVIAFHECIQCEQCMFACPTEALVMYPQGGTPPVLKVPEIDENFQTAVVGQYLIGEVAGKPLVKNAANLGRVVIEHMLQTGMQPGALGAGETNVDVAIVGSGPGGLSAALTCIQKGLSYVVLEKEQMIASTISRYPKGKLVMAEPYDTQNMSLLPVFDAGKEQLIPIWSEVIERVGLKIKQGESVETVSKAADGVFEVRTTVASYRAQRMVLSIGTRGKPRTLQVPGENLPKIYSLLEDPDDWRGKSVLICGGGDSACEAALALADAGAKVMISYRGKGFNRAAPKNKSAIEAYASQGRIKAKLGSQIINFDAETVTLGLNDGSQKRYPNDAAFVLIGADPPIAWLEKVGVKFVERPHQYQLGKTDELVRKFVARAVECPEDAARAAAQVLGGSIGVDAPAPARSIESATAAAAAEMGMMPLGEPVSGPRKWLRSATSIFSTKPGQSGVIPMQGAPVRPDARAQRAKKLDAPMPLSEFAKRPQRMTQHSGHGRRDSLSAGERTRILRMLRDEGGRLADEESQVFIGGGPREYDFDFDDSPPPSAATMIRPDVPAKPAVVVGLAEAQAARSQGKRDKAAPPPQMEMQPQGAMQQPQMQQPWPAPQQQAWPSAPPPQQQPWPAAPQQPWPMAPQPPMELNQPWPAAPQHMQQPWPAAPQPQPPFAPPQPGAQPSFAPAQMAQPAPHMAQPPYAPQPVQPMAPPPQPSRPLPPPPPQPDMLAHSNAPLTLPANELDGLEIDPPRRPRPATQQPRPTGASSRPQSSQQVHPHVQAQPSTPSSRPPSQQVHPHVAQRSPSQQIAAPQPPASAQQPRPKPPSHPGVVPRQTPHEQAAVQPPRSRVMAAVQPPAAAPAPAPARRGPVPFSDEPTRQVDDAMLAALRATPTAKPPAKDAPAKPAGNLRAMHDEPTRMSIDVSAALSPPDLPKFQSSAPPELPRFQSSPSRTVEVSFGDEPGSDDPGADDLTRPRDDFPQLIAPVATIAPNAEPHVEVDLPGFTVEDHRDDGESTKLASVETMAAAERARKKSAGDERSRAVNIRNDPSIADIDWDLD